jgi:hypothetical protein
MRGLSMLVRLRKDAHHPAIGFKAKVKSVASVSAADPTAPSSYEPQARLGTRRRPDTNSNNGSSPIERPGNRETWQVGGGLGTRAEVLTTDLGTEHATIGALLCGIDYGPAA